MNPLEPKPPDPCPPASSFLSWNLPYPFRPKFWPKLSVFYASSSRPDSCLRTFVARFDNPRLDGDASHEPCQFLAFFWTSQLDSLTGSAPYGVKLGGWGMLCKLNRVLKFPKVKLGSVSNTIAIPRQEPQISISLNSSSFHHSLLYSNLLEFVFDHVNDEDSMLYPFGLGIRCKNELSYANDHRLFFNILSCNFIDVEFPTINYSGCSMSFHYNFHDFNSPYCGPSMIELNALFSYERDASDCHKSSSCYHRFGHVNSTSFCWPGWGFWGFNSFHSAPLVNASEFDLNIIFGCMTLPFGLVEMTFIYKSPGTLVGPFMLATRILLISIILSMAVSLNRKLETKSSEREAKELSYGQALFMTNRNGKFCSELFLESITVSDVQVERILPCSSKARFQPAFGPRKSYTLPLSLSSALCLNLALLWAHFFDGIRVCWLLDMGSDYGNLCVLIHQYTFGIYCMYLLFLIICLIRGNVEVPSRNFPRPILLRHKNHPSRFRHGLCMSSVRLVVLLFSDKTKYPLEVVLSFMVV